MDFGLFGAGRVGWLHARNIVDHPGATLRAVYDVDADAARRAVEAFGGTMARSPDEIWNASDIDAVLIASSTDTHVELLQGAIRSGKAAYCEKPVDLDLGRAQAVAAEADGTDVPVFIGFRRRFIAELQAIHAHIRNGAIGPIEMVHMMARDAQPPPLDYIKVSGGFLRDKAIHYFDLLCWLTGEAPVEVQATGACLVDRRIGALGDVDTVMVTLRMPNGALCHISNGRRSAFGLHERVEIYGALGLLQWDPGRDRQFAHATDSGLLLSPAEPAAPYFRQETFAAALDAFIRNVRTGKAVAPTLADGLRAQTIADAATAALDAGRPIAITY